MSTSYLDGSIVQGDLTYTLPDSSGKLALEPSESFVRSTTSPFYDIGYNSSYPVGTIVGINSSCPLNYCQIITYAGQWMFFSVDTYTSYTHSEVSLGTQYYAHNPLDAYAGTIAIRVS